MTRDTAIWVAVVKHTDPGSWLLPADEGVRVYGSQEAQTKERESDGTFYLFSRVEYS